MTKYTKLLNVLPRELEVASGPIEVIYSEVKDSHPIKFYKMTRELTANDHDAFNVVVLGPTGAGKSTLINHIFNRTVCGTSATAQSCTREVKFYRGEMRNKGTREKFKEDQDRHLLVIVKIFPLLCHKIDQPDLLNA